MACTKWFQLIFPSFGWYVIPARHFPQKSLSGNSKIGFPLLPTAKPYPLLPLTQGPPFLYWLGTSEWCLSLVRTSLPCVWQCVNGLSAVHALVLAWGVCLVFAARSVAHSWPLVAWISHWVFILCTLLPPWAEFCLGMGLSFFNPTLALLWVGWHLCHVTPLLLPCYH